MCWLNGPLVLVAVLGHGPVGLVPVAVDRGSWLDRAADERHQVLLADRLHTLHPNPPKPLGMLDLDGDRHERLRLAVPAIGPSLDPADPRLIDLDPAAQTLASGRTIALR